MSKSQKSKELYSYMVKKGYEEEFALQISDILNTDFTASKMIGYLSHFDVLPMVEVADEMFAILTLRDTIVRKHQLENNQAAINEMWARGFDE